MRARVLVQARDVKWGLGTGLHRSSERTAPQVPTVALCLETYGDPKGVGVPYEQGTPAGETETEVDDGRELAFTNGLVDATLQALPGHPFRPCEPHQTRRDRLSGWRESEE